MTKVSTAWLVIGFLGQAVFTARFLVQWAASERRRNSVVPNSFWWLSLAGGGLLIAYAGYRGDPVILVGQGMGLFVYVRNLMLVGQAKRRRVGDGMTTAERPPQAIALAESGQRIAA